MYSGFNKNNQGGQKPQTNQQNQQHHDAEEIIKALSVLTKHVDQFDVTFGAKLDEQVTIHYDSEGFSVVENELIKLQTLNYPKPAPRGKYMSLLRGAEPKMMDFYVKGIIATEVGEKNYIYTDYGVVDGIQENSALFPFEDIQIFIHSITDMQDPYIVSHILQYIWDDTHSDADLQTLTSYVYDIDIPNATQLDKVRDIMDKLEKRKIVSKVKGKVYVINTRDTYMKDKLIRFIARGDEGGYEEELTKYLFPGVKIRDVDRRYVSTLLRQLKNEGRLGYINRRYFLTDVEKSKNKALKSTSTSSARVTQQSPGRSDGGLTEGEYGDLIIDAIKSFNNVGVTFGQITQKIFKNADDGQRNMLGSLLNKMVQEDFLQRNVNGKLYELGPKITGRSARGQQSPKNKGKNEDNSLNKVDTKLEILSLLSINDHMSRDGILRVSRLNLDKDMVDAVLNQMVRDNTVTLDGRFYSLNQSKSNKGSKGSSSHIQPVFSKSVDKMMGSKSARTVKLG